MKIFVYTKKTKLYYIISIIFFIIILISKKLANFILNNYKLNFL